MCVYVDRWFDSLVWHAFICPVGNETTGVRFVRPRHNDCCTYCWWRINTINSTQNTSKIRDLGRSLSLSLHLANTRERNSCAAKGRGVRKKVQLFIAILFLSRVCKTANIGHRQPSSAIRTSPALKHLKLEETAFDMLVSLQFFSLSYVWSFLYSCSFSRPGGGGCLSSRFP